MAEVMSAAGNLMSGSSQLLGTLFGTDVAMSQSGKQTTTGTATSKTEQAASQTAKSTQDILASIIENLVRSSQRTEEQKGSSAEAKQEETQLFADEDIGGLRGFLQTLMQGAATAQTRFSPEAAVRDTEGAVTRLSRQLQEQVIPGIVNQDAIAGAYGSTAVRQLVNDAIARTSEAGASLQLQTIADYNSQRLASLAPVLNAFSLLRGAEASSKTAGSTTSAVTGTSSEQSSQQSNQQSATKQTGQTDTEQKNTSDTTQTQESETISKLKQVTDEEGVLESIGGALGF